MDKLRLGTSYWIDQFTGTAPQHPVLKGAHHVHIAVIGGGITGCLAAHAFVHAGFSVLLLEANRIARASMLSRQTEHLRADLSRVYPALEHTAIDYAWDGLFATTSDGLPYIGTHRHYPRHLFALGYGGNGMTFGFLAAEVLVRTVRNTITASDRFLGFHRIR